MPSFFDKAKLELRRLESANNVQPVLFKKKKAKNGDEVWEIELDKLVLYVNPTYEDNTIFQANRDLDCGLHAKALERFLEEEVEHKDLHFNVAVNPQFKTFPIPFFSIPIKIPFTDIGWEKQPNKVRTPDLNLNDLGVLPTTVKISISGSALNELTGTVLWKKLNQIASLHTDNFSRKKGKNFYISKLVPIAERPSKNPFRWMMAGLGWIGSKTLPQSLLDRVPTFISKKGRPYHYGAWYDGKHKTNLKLDMPFINSGIFSNSVNALIFSVPGIAMGYFIKDTFKSLTANPPTSDSSTKGIFEKMRGRNKLKDEAVWSGICSKNNFLNIDDRVIAHLPEITPIEIENEECLNWSKAPFATRTVLRQN